MTKISDTETAAFTGSNMKDFSRKASTNEEPAHQNSYEEIKVHPNSFSSPGFAADVLHDNSGVLSAVATPAILANKEKFPACESVGMHHVK